jgi:hypothetical protein
LMYCTNFAGARCGGADSSMWMCFGARQNWALPQFWCSLLKTSYT